MLGRFSFLTRGVERQGSHFNGLGVPDNLTEGKPNFRMARHPTTIGRHRSTYRFLPTDGRLTPLPRKQVHGRNHS